MAATQTKGFELFTKTFQEQYNIDASILRSVAWDVWQNELSEADRQVWERMSTPKPDSSPESTPDSKQGSAPESTPDAKNKLNKAPAEKHQKAPAPEQQPPKKPQAKAAPEPAPTPKNRPAKPEPAPEKAEPPLGAAVTPEPQTPEPKTGKAAATPAPSAPSAPMDDDSARKQTPAPEPDKAEGKAAPAGQDARQQRPEPAPEPKPEAKEPQQQQRGKDKKAAAEPPAPPSGAVGQQGAAPSEPPQAAPHDTAAPSKEEARKKPSAAQRLGGMFASLKRMRDKPETKQPETAPFFAAQPETPRAALKKTQAPSSAAAQEKAPADADADSADTAQTDASAAAAAPTHEREQKKQPLAMPGDPAPGAPDAKKSSPVKETGAAPSLDQPAAPPPLEVYDAQQGEKQAESAHPLTNADDAAAAAPSLETTDSEGQSQEDLSDDWRPGEDESFFLESDTIPPPTAPGPAAAGPGADILRDVLTHQPAEDVGIAESMLISRKPRHKAGPAASKAPEPAGSEEQSAKQEQPSTPKQPSEAKQLSESEQSAGAKQPDQPEVQAEPEQPAQTGQQAETPTPPPAGADADTRQAPDGNEQESGESGLQLDQVLDEEDTGQSAFLDALGETTPPARDQAAAMPPEPPKTTEGTETTESTESTETPETAEPMEIEPIDDDDPDSFVVDESAAPMGPMPDPSATKRVVARFRAAAEAEDDLSDPEFLVEESDVLQERSHLARARHAAAQRLSEHAESLVNALLQRSLQGDAMALSLCIRHVLPEKMLRSVAQALGERALQLGTHSHPGLLALLAGKQATPTASEDQVREMVDRLSQQALAGDLAAMEVCLRLCAVPQQLHESTAPLTEKLLHRALEGDALLLALFLEHLGPVQLSDEDTQLLKQTLLKHCEEGEESALKACLASLFED